MAESKKNKQTSVDETDPPDMLDLALHSFYQKQHEHIGPTAEDMEALRQLRRDHAQESPVTKQTSTSILHRWFLWLPTLAAASLALVWWVPQWTSPPLVLRAKGVSWQFLYARKGNAKGPRLLTREIKSGAALHPKDLIQFAYQFSQSTHVAIVGMTEQGKSYILLDNGKQHSLLVPKGKGALPQENGQVRAFELDSYLGKERFFVVTSSKSFSLQRFQQKLQDAWKKTHRLAKLSDVPGPWRVSSVWIHKRR